MHLPLEKHLIAAHVAKTSLDVVISLATVSRAGHVLNGLPLN